MIAIIDYGMGNLRSVQKALESLGQQAIITSSSKDIEQAARLILPGVGAFSKAMENLRKHKLLDPIANYVKTGRPFLGICLGMQLLMETSEEHGDNQGLGLIKGAVRNFRNNARFEQNLTVPHMGWNDVQQVGKPALLKGLDDKFQVYFVHSFYVQPENPKTIIGQTTYGLTFCSIIQQENVYGAQFHPEKSGNIGLQILKNFTEI